MRTSLTAFLCFISFLPTARAELPSLRESPAGSVSLDIGVTNVKIDYHRPGVKGREIWGKLVPYGEVWRAGANQATNIEFGDEVKVEGHDVPKGVYAFFAIPEKDKWTLIISKQARTWGAYEYKQSEDVARFEVKPQPAPMTEWLAYELSPTSDHSARAELVWEKLRVPFNIEVDVQGIYKKLVLDAIARARPDDPKDRTVYFQAADFYYNHNLDPQQALIWIDQSLKLKEMPFGLALKGNILHRLGRDREARATMDKALAAAKAAELPAEFGERVKKSMESWKK